LTAGKPIIAIGTGGPGFAPANGERVREYLAGEIAK